MEQSVGVVGQARQSTGASVQMEQSVGVVGHVEQSAGEVECVGGSEEVEHSVHRGQVER